jgi:phosphatidylglycerophosphate synthase
MLLRNDTHRRPDAFGLVAKKAGRFDGVLELGLRSVRVIPGCPILFEKRRRHHVNAFVRALRRKNGGNQQLQRIFEIELRVRVGVDLWQSLNQPGDTLLRFHLGIISKTCYRFNATNMPGTLDDTMDRRPIATRDSKWARAAATWLALRRVSPNAISIAGMCACLLAGLALASTSFLYSRVEWIIAALGMQLRLTANMLDGMVALATGRASKRGELYNEVPDRVSDAVVFIGAGLARGGNITLGYVAAILAIFTAYIRAAGKIAGAPNEFCGPMAKQHRMFVMTLVCLYSAVTPRSWQTIEFAGLETGVMSLGLAVISAGCLWTVGRRLHRVSRALR